MLAPTGAGLLLPSKTRDFHRIRPVCALGAFPSEGKASTGRIHGASSKTDFFDKLKPPLNASEEVSRFLLNFKPGLSETR